MDNTAFSVREMRDTDLPTCLEFTQKVKWPHRMLDWQLHFSRGQGSVIEDINGEIVGCILWWDYGKDYATVGLVVVPDHMQGNGLGRKLMDTVISQTGARNLQLVATIAGKRLYQQCGFQEKSFIYQVQGHLSATVRPISAEVSLKPLDNSTLQDVLALDKAAYQCLRGALLKAIAEMGEGVVAYRGTDAVGFAIIRESGRGQTIGPVIANDENIAQALVNELLMKADGFVRFDLTESAQGLKPWLEALGLEQVDKVSLMVKGEFLPANAAETKVFSLASQAFG